MRKLLKHLFSLHEDEITGKIPDPQKENTQMLQLSAILASIGKIGRLVIIGLIVIAIAIVTAKVVSYYKDYGKAKEIDKISLEVTKQAAEQIRIVNEASKINTDAVITTSDIKVDTAEKKGEIDKIVNEFVKNTEKVKVDTASKVKETLPKNPATSTSKTDPPVNEGTPTEPATLPEISPKVKAISALSDLLDNEISNLPAMV